MLINEEGCAPYLGCPQGILSEKKVGEKKLTWFGDTGPGSISFRGQSPTPDPILEFSRQNIAATLEELKAEVSTR